MADQADDDQVIFLPVYILYALESYLKTPVSLQTGSTLFEGGFFVGAWKMSYLETEDNVKITAFYDDKQVATFETPRRNYYAETFEASIDIGGRTLIVREDNAQPEAQEKVPINAPPKAQERVPINYKIPQSAGSPKKIAAFAVLGALSVFLAYAGMPRNRGRRGRTTEEQIDYLTTAVSTAVGTVQDARRTTQMYWENLVRHWNTEIRKSILSGDSRARFPDVTLQEASLLLVDAAPRDSSDVDNLNRYNRLLQHLKPVFTTITGTAPEGNIGYSMRPVFEGPYKARFSTLFLYSWLRPLFPILYLETNHYVFKPVDENASGYLEVITDLIFNTSFFVDWVSNAAPLTIVALESTQWRDVLDQSWEEVPMEWVMSFLRTQTTPANFFTVLQIFKERREDVRTRFAHVDIRLVTPLLQHLGNMKAVQQWQDSFVKLLEKHLRWLNAEGERGDPEDLQNLELATKLLTDVTDFAKQLLPDTETSELVAGLRTLYDGFAADNELITTTNMVQSILYELTLACDHRRIFDTALRACREEKRNVTAFAHSDALYLLAKIRNVTA